MNVIEKYHERIMEMYLQAHPNADPNKVRQLCETLTEKRLKDIPCVMHNNMTHELVESTMINTFEWLINVLPLLQEMGRFSNNIQNIWHQL
jgi:phosphohistidine phosphatase SixA